MPFAPSSSVGAWTSRPGRRVQGFRRSFGRPSWSSWGWSKTARLGKHSTAQLLEQVFDAASSVGSTGVYPPEIDIICFSKWLCVLEEVTAVLQVDCSTFQKHRLPTIQNILVHVVGVSQLSALAVNWAAGTMQWGWAWLDEQGRRGALSRFESNWWHSTHSWASRKQHMQQIPFLGALSRKVAW